MLNEKETERMARKMVLMSESSLKVMNIMADALLARDQIESQNISVNYSHQFAPERKN